MAVLKLLRIGNPRPGCTASRMSACVYEPVFTATTLSLYWRPSGSGGAISGARIGAGGHAVVRAVVLHVQ